MINPLEFPQRKEKVSPFENVFSDHSYSLIEDRVRFSDYVVSGCMTNVNLVCEIAMKEGFFAGGPVLWLIMIHWLFILT